MLEALITDGGYFGNDAWHGYIYAHCTILIHLPEYGSDEHMAATEAAFNAAYKSTLPTDAFTSTRAGMSARMEDAQARSRFDKCERNHLRQGEDYY